MAVILVGHLVHNGDVKSTLLSKFLENRGIALAAPAKMKIISGDDMGSLHFFNQVLLDEILRLQHGQGLVEIQAEDK